MQITELFNSKIPVEIDFRGHTIIAVIKPDVYTFADLVGLNENSAVSMATYIQKGLDDLYLLNNGKKETLDGKDKKPLKLTVENLVALLSESMMVALIKTIGKLKESVAGKPQTPPG